MGDCIGKLSMYRCNMRLIIRGCGLIRRDRRLLELCPLGLEIVL